MALGFTYPRTSSDTAKPVTAFRDELVKVIRRMEQSANQRASVPNLSQRTRDIYNTAAVSYRNIIEMLENIIIEGE